MSSLSELFHVQSRRTPPDNNPDRPHVEIGWTLDQLNTRYGPTHMMSVQPILKSEDFRLDEEIRQKFAKADAHRRKAYVVGHVDRWGTDFTVSVDLNEDGRVMEMTWWPTDGAVVTSHTFSAIEQEVRAKSGAGEKSVDGDEVMFVWAGPEVKEMLTADMGSVTPTDLFYQASFAGYDTE